MLKMFPNEEGRVFENDEDDDFGIVLVRLRKGKSDLSSSRKPHNCSHIICNPESEPSLVASGQLDGPPISTNVFLCQYGTIHICSASSCTLYLATHNQTCSISGFQLGVLQGSYDKNDDRTW